MISKFFKRKSIATFLQTKKFTQTTKFSTTNIVKFFKISGLVISSATALFFFKKEFKSDEKPSKIFNFEEIGLNVDLTDEWNISFGNDGLSNVYFVQSTNPIENENTTRILFNNFEKSEEMNLETYSSQIVERVKHSQNYNPNIECQNLNVETKKTKNGLIYTDITFIIVDRMNSMTMGNQLLIFFENGSSIIFLCENEASSFKKDYLASLIETMRK
jgi:hypothetical protein